MRYVGVSRRSKKGKSNLPIKQGVFYCFYVEFHSLSSPCNALFKRLADIAMSVYIAQE